MAAIMKFLLCVALVFALFDQSDGRSPIGKRIPKYRPFRFQCGRGRVLTGIRSSLFARPLDRWFRLRCSRWKVPTGRCYWSLPSAYRNDFSVSCKCGHVLSGMKSAFSFKQRDRTYSFRCCEAKDVAIVNCHRRTGGMMKHFNLDIGHFRAIGTVDSKFTCLGRKFSFEVCRLAWKVHGGPARISKKLQNINWLRLKKLQKMTTRKLHRLYTAIKNAKRRGKKHHLWKKITKTTEWLQILKTEMHRRWHRKLKQKSIKQLKHLLNLKRNLVQLNEKKSRNARRKLKNAKGKWRKQWLKLWIRSYEKQINAAKNKIIVLIKQIKTKRGNSWLKKLKVLKLTKAAKMVKKKIHTLIKQIKQTHGKKRKGRLWVLIKKETKLKRFITREIYRRWLRKLKRRSVQRLKHLLKWKRISLRRIKKKIRRARRKLKKAKGKWRKRWIWWTIRRYTRHLKTTRHVIRLLIRLIGRNKGNRNLRKLNLFKLKRMLKRAQRKVRSLHKKFKHARGKKRKGRLWVLIKKSRRWARFIRREIYRRWLRKLRRSSVRRLKHLLKRKRISLRRIKNKLRRARRKLKKAKGKWRRRWIWWTIRRYTRHLKTTRHVIRLLIRLIGRNKGNRNLRKLSLFKLKRMLKRAQRNVRSLHKKFKHARGKKRKGRLWVLIKKSRRWARFIRREIYRRWLRKLRRSSVRRLKHLLKRKRISLKRIKKNLRRARWNLKKAKGKWRKQWIMWRMSGYKRDHKTTNHVIRLLLRLIGKKKV